MLTEKTALITGASRGIGKVISIELAKNKVNVVINYKEDENQVKEVVDEIKKFGVDCTALKADVSDFDEVKAMFEDVKKDYNGLDILINNAGILLDKTLKNMPLEIWKSVINVNLNGIFNVTKNALPLMKENGRIISISSIIGLDGNFGQTNYAASKAGVIGFTKSLAKELAKKKITVNAIAPGFIKTYMTDNVPSESKKTIENMIPLGEFGVPEDVSNAVVFLSSSKSRYITGEVIRVDGGLNL